MERLRYLKPNQIKEIRSKFGTPVFVYSENVLKCQARKALSFPAPYGLTVRYAMKANPNARIISTFEKLGIHIDASSGFEAERAIRAGVNPKRVLITAQELPVNMEELISQGVLFDACSLHQLRKYGELFPNSNIGIRINPGLGSGHSNKTNVGGPASSFGIWYEYTDQIKDLTRHFGLKVTRLHTHIGSGTNPAIWEQAALMSLRQVENFPDVETLNIGGGFKVARTYDEIDTDINSTGRVISEALRRFAKQSGRILRLEIEPGTFLTANSGSLITTIRDIVDTGEKGYTFLKIDSGMTEILRPILYGAQHPLVVVNELKKKNKKYIIVGHCCESGDLLTPYPGDPESLLPRLMQHAEIGDTLVIEGVGAYCAYMSSRNYNSFPLRPEIMLQLDDSVTEISRCETIDEMINLEV